MMSQSDWVSAFATISVILLYEVVLWVLRKRRPDALARAAHASLREDWFLAVSARKGSEILGVQTLRNSLMSATMLASTCALGLMGTVTLAAPSLHTTFEAGGVVSENIPRLALELVLLGLLFASLVSTMMAVRLYNHVGFIVGIPIESEARQRWNAAGVEYVRRAGILYGVGLRQLVLVVPIVAAILTPTAGPLAAIIVCGVLFSFERFKWGGAER